MLSRTRRGLRGARAAVAGAVVAGTLVVSLGVAVPSSSAGSSAFCSTLISYYAQYASKFTPPAKLTTATYHAWAKALVPFYEKLASEAPNATTKTELNYVVVILKYEAKDKTLSNLEAYVAANHVKFEKGTSALAKAIKSCA